MSVENHAYSGGDGGSKSTGNLTLKIGGGAPVTAVPDSSATLGLIALGLAALAAMRRQPAMR